MIDFRDDEEVNRIGIGTILKKSDYSSNVKVGIFQIHSGRLELLALDSFNRVNDCVVDVKDINYLSKEEFYTLCDEEPSLYTVVDPSEL